MLTEKSLMLVDPHRKERTWETVGIPDVVEELSEMVKAIKRTEEAQETQMYTQAVRRTDKVIEMLEMIKKNLRSRQWAVNHLR